MDLCGRDTTIKKVLKNKMNKKIEESKRKAQEYSKMTPKEKIAYNLEGIKKELEDKGVNTSCHCHRLHCIDCAISEISNNVKLLTEKT